MEPGIDPGDHILVYLDAFDSSGPKQGDLVVVRPPGHGATIVPYAASESSVMFVERVIGLPGETVAIRDDRVQIRAMSGVDCRYLHEPYLAVGLPMERMAPEAIPPGHYFLMGDNRGLAEDSRVWGPAPERNIVGGIWATYWPVDRFHLY
jgi:signal peptidase I